MPEKTNEKLEELIKYFKKIEKDIEEMKAEIKELKAKIEPIETETVLRGGRVINLELTKKEILKILKEEGKPLSAADVSQKIGISRSHSSALLNELFREGKVNKIRVGKTIKFQVA